MEMQTYERNLLATLSQSWWLMLLRGLCSIAFGVIAWLQPGISLYALVILFGALALTDGALGTAGAIAGWKQHEDLWLLLLSGLSGIGIGLVTFLVPGITALMLVFYIAIWAITLGVLRIALAVRLRKEIEGEWILGFSGFLDVVFGAVLIVQPVAGALALLWLIAAYAIVLGVLSVLLSFKLKGLGSLAGAPRDVPPARAHAAR